MGYKNSFYIFDMDGTLTPSRQRMSIPMEAAILKLARRRAVIIISGATAEQMEKQIYFREMWKCTYGQVNLTKMSQNGNVCYSASDRLWNRTLHIYEKLTAYGHIKEILDVFGGECLDSDDLVEDRGAQISFSMLGHNAPRESKISFDPDGKLRNKILKYIPFDAKNMTIRVGGTTCFDYIRSDGTKADNLRRLLKPVDLRHSVYVGDQLYPGGNDHDVRSIEGLDCHQVRGPEETLEFIQMELESL